MPVDLLTLGTTFLRDKLRSHASVEITFSRGDQSIQVYATRGSSEWPSTDRNGSIIRTQTNDYIMAANQFADFGLPEEFDLITDHNQTFEVLSENGAQWYQFSDGARTIIRVHTKRVQ
jgi:hypothetical protein